MELLGMGAMELGRTRLRWWGRALLVLGLVGLLAALRPGSAPAAEEPGIGRAAAVLVRLDPRQAGLSFGVQFGPTQADHRNTVARATAQSTDYGLVGSSLTAPGCDGSDPAVGPETLPQEQRADSREKGAGTVATTQEGPVTQSVVASGKPFAQATSKLADMTLPGILTMRGARNETRSGLGDDGRRFAFASAHVGELSLGGGLVELGSMDWVASNRGGSTPTGSFAMGTASIAGVPMSTDDPAAVFKAVNDALGTLGIQVTPPTVTLVDNTMYVSALTVAVVPNANRDLIAKTVLGGIQPLREQLFGPLIEADCANASYILVADLLLGSVTGAGTFEASLAGVWAETGLPEEFVFAPVPPAPPVAPAPVADPGVPEVPEVAVDTIATVPSPAPSGSSTETAGEPISTAAPVDDRAAAVALASLLLGGALMEGDRRKMRRAVRAAETGATS